MLVDCPHSWKLHEFVDLSSEEIPNVLPPLINIQHQIDFQLGAMLRNLPCHRMSLENMKFFRVEEL